MPEVTIVGELERPEAEDLQIYRLKKATADREAIERIAKRVGMKGEIESGMYCENISSHVYTEGAWNLTMYRESGGWKFRHRQRWQADDGSANLRIEDEDAIVAAREVIEKFDVAPAEDFEPMRVARLRVATSERGSGKSDERVIDVGVGFRRLVRGVPVEGPGGKIVVYLDHERTATGIDHLWREIEGVHEPVKRLRSTEDAIEAIRRLHEGPGGGKVELTGLRFGYFEMGWHHDQEFLQPAYVAFLRLISPDERIRMNSVFVVAAAENRVGEIEPAPVRVTAQPRREASQT